ALAVALGPRGGDPEAELTGHWWKCFFHLQLGDTRMARQEVEMATRLADELKEPAYRWYPAGLEAASAVFEGRFDDAVELIPRAYELGRGALGFNATVSYRLQMFALHRERGVPPYRPDALASLVTEYETYTILRCALAVLLLDDGHEADARAVFEDLARDEFGGLYLDEEWLASMTLLADVCAVLGDRERAQVLYRQLLPFARLNAHAFPEMTLGSIERPLGVLAALCGDWDAAEGHLTRAIEVNAQMGGRPWMAHARHDFARALIDKAEPGDRERASELLADALDTYRELAMKPWEERAEADRQRLEETGP
ncbi:MAG TPA: hypothetical protein VK919_15020, partial [Solirubrobacterales bacterium]|nr:hypothetical protein [Solirubrobacterales bacterium]